MRKGSIKEVIDAMIVVFPTVLQKHPDVLFKLMGQHFIELIRHRKMQEALEFAQKELRSFAKSDPAFENHFKEIFPLIAYEDPEASPLGECLSDAYKERVASSLNSAILVEKNLPAEASMEILIRYLTVAREMADGDKKERWTLRNWLRTEGDG